MKHAAWLSFASATALVLLASTRAHADDPKARAKEAYARGLAAHDAHDYKAAARAFAEADAILPSPTALTAALDAAVEADDPVLGNELLERGERPGATPELTKSLADARAKLGGRAGKLRLVCPAGSTCNALIDERTMPGEIWVSVGTHTVTTRVDATTTEQTIEVHPGETITLSPKKTTTVPLPPPGPVEAPPPRASSVPNEDPNEKKTSFRSLPPLITYVGAGVTLALAGGAITTGILTKNRHDAFVEEGCDKANNPGCVRIKHEGVPLLVMTDVFLGAAILTGLATTGVALFLTDWHPSAAVTSRGASFGIGRTF